MGKKKMQTKITYANVEIKLYTEDTEEVEVGDILRCKR